MRWKWCFLVIGLLLSFAAHAETGLSDADIDKLAAQSGTEVTKSQEGDTQITEIRRAGVVVTIRRHRDKAETIGEDRSGHGAVLCQWKLSISVRAGLNLCFPQQYPEYREDLDYAIAAMNDFIVANSLSPTTKGEVEAEVAALDERARKQRDEARTQLGPEELQRKCGASIFGRRIAEFAQTTTREQRRKELSDLLSVPRPPVTAPCI